MTMPQLMEALAQDLRFAIRTLRKSPGFTLVAAGTLALGIGANAALFTIVDRVLLRPPAGVHDPDHVVRLYVVNRTVTGGEESWPMGYPDYAALADEHRAFSAVAAYEPPGTMALATSDGSTLRKVHLESVTPNFFPVLGVRPALGRFFTVDENRPPNGSPVAVLSYELWQTQFGGDPHIVGRTIRLDQVGYYGRNRVPFTVVGVAPRHFSGVDLDAAELWVPIAAAAGESFGPGYRTSYFRASANVLARLRPGVTPAQATAAATIAVRRAFLGAKSRDDIRAQLGSIIATRGPGPQAHAVAVAARLAGVAAIVLLIACANIANLLLARATQRRREIAVRLALGISRRRLVGQLLTESGLLALLGGAAALLLAYWGGLLLRVLLLPRITWAGSPVDLRVVGFTAVVTIATALLAGLIPALHGSRADLTTALKAGWRSRTSRLAAIRTGLLIVQAALSVVLLVGAGLFVRSLQRVHAIDLGVDADELVAAMLSPASRDGARKLPPDFDAQLAEIVERVRTMPGVAEVATSYMVPLLGEAGRRFSIPGRDSLPPLQRTINYVSPDFFTTVGTRLVRGRAFTPTDRRGAPLVAIVNETMARAVWPGESALGQCVKIGERPDTLPCTTVVGVVHDTHQMQLVERPLMQLYQPITQSRATLNTRSLVVRATSDPAALEAPLRSVLSTELPQGMQVRLMRLREAIDPQLRPWRLGVMMFGAFGLLALVVASVGLYSVVSYSVAQRTHEMGVRVALGARPADVARLVLGQSVRVALIGVVIGCVIAVAAGAFIASLLYDTSVHDPLVFGVVAVVLVTVAVVASLVPARRATRVDPVVALMAD